jgi:putative transposase
MRHTQATEIVSAALDLAIQRARPTAGLIHHSDHGSQYDNALAESFFATLECELIDRERSPRARRRGRRCSTTSRPGTTRGDVTRPSTT